MTQTKGKPKFKVGQVVAAKIMSGQGGQIGWNYFRILEIKLQTEGHWYCRELWTWHSERNLRGLTKREVGR
jgi:hypothetical protein